VPLPLFAVNTGATASASNVGSASNPVDFALASPDTFVAGAAAFSGLGGGLGSTSFAWGMPFFYGRKIYIAFDAHTVGSLSGPFYAY